MNLAIDIGNTNLKYAIFEGEKIVLNGVEKNTEAFDLSKLFSIYPIKNSILCTVNKVPELMPAQLKQKTNYISFSSVTPTPVKNLYKSKATLGSDRIAVASGAFAVITNTPVLAIDTGTCIKYNFINSNAEFIGGGISPGIDMRLKALNSFTHQLPLVNADYNFNLLVGENTEQSILSGVMNGTLKEMDGIIQQYQQQYPSLKTVITGGNHAFFAERLKSSIFADPFLLLKGLNAIIEFNVH